jgi:hypothetical protein
LFARKKAICEEEGDSRGRFVREEESDFPPNKLHPPQRPSPLLLKES